MTRRATIKSVHDRRCSSHYYNWVSFHPQSLVSLRSDVIYFVYQKLSCFLASTKSSFSGIGKLISRTIFEMSDGKFK
jgi:hypothetical protein